MATKFPQKLFRVIRARDQLNVQFELENFDYEGPVALHPERVIARADATISVVFDPQHIAEEVHVFDNANADARAKKEAYARRISGHSRLVFSVPKGMKIKFTLDDLLAHCERADVRLEPVGAILPDAPNAHEDPAQLKLGALLYSPTDPHVPRFTSVELPRHMVLEPRGRWTMSPRLASSRTGSLPWHVRLDKGGGVRIIHNRQTEDWPGSEESQSLKPGHRRGLLHATILERPLPYQVHATRRLLLSGVGGWLDLDATFDTPPAEPIERWTHRAAMGRDQYVKVVEKGFLFPLGLRAVYITETDRRIRKTADGAPVALLEKRYYVELRDVAKDFTIDSETDLATASAKGIPGYRKDLIRGGRALGMARVDLARFPLRTPALDPEASDNIVAEGGRTKARWLRINGVHHPFPLDVFDAESKSASNERTATTAARLIWVASDLNESGGAPLDVVSTHWAQAAPSVRRWFFGGQKLGLVPAVAIPDDSRPAALVTPPATVKPTSRIPTFALEIGDLKLATNGWSEGLPRFHPQVRAADVRVPEIDSVLAGAENAVTAALDVPGLMTRATTGLRVVETTLIDTVDSAYAYAIALSGLVEGIRAVDPAAAALAAALETEARGAAAAIRARRWFDSLIADGMKSVIDELRQRANDLKALAERAIALQQKLSTPALSKYHTALKERVDGFSGRVEAMKREFAKLLANGAELDLPFENVRSRIRDVIAELDGKRSRAEKLVDDAQDGFIGHITGAGQRIRTMLDHLSDLNAVVADDAKDALERANRDLELIEVDLRARATALKSQLSRVNVELRAVEARLSRWDTSIADVTERLLETINTLTNQLGNGILEQIESVLDLARADVERRMKDAFASLVLRNIAEKLDQLPPAQAAMVRAVAELHGAIESARGLAETVVGDAERAARAMVGDGRVPVVLRHYPKYIEHGFAAINPAKTWAEFVRKDGAAFVTSGIPLPFSRAFAAGIVCPDFHIAGLSLRLGPVSDFAKDAANQVVSDLASIFHGEFNPMRFLPSMMLFGAIDIREILRDVRMDATSSVERKVPGLKIEPHFDPPGATATFEWATTTKPSSKGLFRTGEIERPLAAGEGSPFKIKVTQAVRGGESRSSTIAQLDRFTLNFLEMIEVSFSTVTVDADSHDGVKVSPKISSVRLGPSLDFFQALVEMAGDLAGVAPKVKLIDGALRTGFELSFPSLGGTPFMFMNVALGAAVDLSLRGEPLAARFNFASRRAPFTMAVSIFGGGGFFAIELQSKGRMLKRMELAIEFGGIFGFNAAGVASGTLAVMAGLYIESNGSWARFTAYIRFAGTLSVLGLITVSLHAMLALTYSTETRVLSGSVQVTVDIEFLFFSVSASFTVRKEFNKPSSLFLEADRPPIDQNMVAEYLRAFA